MNLIACCKVISANRVYLAPALRKSLDVKEGDFVSFFSDEDGKIIVDKVTR